MHAAGARGREAFVDEQAPDQQPVNTSVGQVADGSAGVDLRRMFRGGVWLVAPAVERPTRTAQWPGSSDRRRRYARAVRSRTFLDEALWLEVKGFPGASAKPGRRADGAPAFAGPNGSDLFGIVAREPDHDGRGRLRRNDAERQRRDRQAQHGCPGDPRPSAWRPSVRFAGGLSTTSTIC